MRSESYPYERGTCRSPVLSAGEKERNHLSLFFRALPWGILNLCRMKPLSERPAESRKPWTRFYGITAKESGLLLLKTDRSTRIPRITSNDGLSLPCSSSVLMNMMHKYLFLRATSQVAACRHLATAARVKYPAALQRGIWLKKRQRYCKVNFGRYVYEKHTYRVGRRQAKREYRPACGILYQRCRRGRA